ncbi:YdcF family protein, partial [Listeria monocytogenes]|nr:YdcF family protein [Listeria monocytogenes]EAG8228462.1 YdcF family protein [Listeria monocytogenes]EDN7561341.1 YdcF family protein [Listeria monocytogenes]
REFIAITVMYKKVHMVLLGLLLLFFAFLAIIGVTFR